MFDALNTQHNGPRGNAVLVDNLNPDTVGAETTVTMWLLTGDWHPVWSQFVLVVVTLRDTEGHPPAHLHFVGATHELLVMALPPGKPPVLLHSADELRAGGLAAVGGYLIPVDVVHQFTATDAEMTQLANLTARACVDGVLTPSTDDARAMLREQWLEACVKTLAHMRGEEHAE